MFLLSIAAILLVVAAVVGWSWLAHIPDKTSAASTARTTDNSTEASTSPHASSPTPQETPTPSPTATPVSLGASLTPGTTIVTIGDSIMAGHGLTDPNTSAWPIRLGALTGTHVINDSCSGAGFITTGDCGTNYNGLIPAAQTAHPAMIIIESSDNDLGQDPTQLATATTTTLTTLTTDFPQARIVGLSTLWDQPGQLPAEVTQSTTDLQTALTAVGGTFINLGQPLAGQSEMLQSDNEHPTDQGQQTLANTILTDLNTTPD